MFKRSIESAFHTASEMVVHIKGQEESFRGVVQDYDGEYFTLFHSGCCQGVLWTLRIEDVIACALVIPKPTEGRLHHDEAQPVDFPQRCDT